MGEKLTATKMIGGFAAFMVIIFSMTAIAWVRPDDSGWVLGTTLVLLALLLAFLYRGARKANPPD